MSEAITSVVRFEDVSLRFGDTVALDHVSFQLNPGESRIIFGAAGSGKTTLLKVAVGLLRVDSGRVWLWGEDITRRSEKELLELRSRVGILFQEGALFDSLTIEDNVAYPLVNHPSLRKPAARNGHGDAAQRPVEERVRETLRFVELEQTLQKFPSELSGGMRRRVGIARAVVTEPGLVLYDSPTAGLDPITANTIIALIVKERDLRNAAAILVTHRYQDGHLMANFSYNPDSSRMEPAQGAEKEKVGVRTKFMVMNEGRLVFEGVEAELQACQDSYVRNFLRPGAA